MRAKWDTSGQGQELKEMKLAWPRSAMAPFVTILPALIEGQGVQRTEWEPVVRMFVLDGTLMCRCGDANPWHQSLTWGEITASDWQLVQSGSTPEIEHQTSVVPIPNTSGRAFRNLFDESGPLHNSLFFGPLLKWWNTE